MAVTKLWAVHGRLKRVLDYAADPKKTAANPTKAVTDPAKTAANPTKVVTDPEKTAANPEKTAAVSEEISGTDFQEAVQLEGRIDAQPDSTRTDSDDSPASTGPSYSRRQYQALADVLAYAKDEEKTEREFYVEGINCDPSTARDEFITVKEQYAKTDGVQAYHGYMSFAEQDITPEQALQAGLAFAREVWGSRFQVVVTVHQNTQHLHCHFVINSVSFVDGKKLADKEKAWFSFSKVADRICKEYGLQYDPEPVRSRGHAGYDEHRAAQTGMPTRYCMVKEAVDTALAHSHTIEELEANLLNLGYTGNFQPTHKYWTVIPKGYNRPMRLKNLGEDYTNAAIEKRLQENREHWMEIVPLQMPLMQERRKRQSIRTKTQKNYGHLYGLYLYYCYLLGYFPKQKRRSSAWVDPLLKEDLLKLDLISAQTQFLYTHQIETEEQLSACQASCIEASDALMQEREALRRRLRTQMPAGEKEEIRERIQEITNQLRPIRRDIRFCEDILHRSRLMQEKLDRVEEQEKENEKGKKNEKRKGNEKERKHHLHEKEL